MAFTGTKIDNASDEYGDAITDQPKQRLASRQKGKKWGEENVRYLTDHIFSEDHRTRRKSRSDMLHYYNVLHGIVDSQDMKDTFDPLGVNEEEDMAPENVVAYNPLKKGFRTLFNEERKRNNDVKAMAINPEVINQKDIEFKERLFGYLRGLEEELQQDESIDPKLVEEQLDEITYWGKHDLQSAHEVMANQLLNYFIKSPEKRAAHTFSKGFQNLTILGEEIHRVGNVGEEPCIFPVDSANFTVLGMGKSDDVEDGTAWIEWDYLNLSSINEEFELTNREYEDLRIMEKDYVHSGGVYQLTDAEISASQIERARDNNSFTIEEDGRGQFFVGGRYVDEEGNILVARCQWVSQRKIGKLTSFDEEDNEVISLQDENYVPDESRGETIEWIWVDEIWEGVRIGRDLYKNIQPCISQMRSLNNPKRVRPYYVGSLLTYGQNNKASSVMDELLVFKRDFDLWSNKLRKLWMRHIGSTIRVDLARLPEGMDKEEWLYWVKALGISWEDSFKQSPEGQIAGNMQSQNPLINASTMEEVNGAIQMLTYLQGQIDTYMSTPASRTGELQGDEGLGVTQQSIVGATLSTEDLYITHDELKIRVFTVWLEFTKQLWGEENTVKQYVLDDLSQNIFDYDGKLMQEAEFGVVLTNSSKLRDFQQKIEAYGQAFAQNGNVTFSGLMHASLAGSAVEMQKRIEADEENQRRREQELEQQRSQSQQELEQLRQQGEERRHEMELEKIRLKGELDIMKERVKIEGQRVTEEPDMDRDGMNDRTALEKEEIKARSAKEVKRMEMDQRSQEHRDQVQLDSRELDLRAKELASKPKPGSNE